jgi:hypothetical protein
MRSGFNSRREWLIREVGDGSSSAQCTRSGGCAVRAWLAFVARHICQPDVRLENTLARDCAVRELSRCITVMHETLPTKSLLEAVDFLMFCHPSF